ncbi:MAG: glycosyltransferase family 2 protein [Verrucomicrobia bacterium]|nr:glycosyltransferase family 2 protein [Verrucomicrobiota bacterium]
MNTATTAPVISVIVLNYEGARWIERCLKSLQAQTIFPQIEVIVTDNASRDGSNHLAAQLLADWPNGKLLQFDENLGFCGGNNRGAAVARGQFLFFLNNDTWLEPDCLEKLLAGVRAANAQVATPLVLNYDDDTEQLVLAAGFDIFGLPSFAEARAGTYELFMPPGCSYLIDAALFRELGGFDPKIFLYADELDLSWRVWISGYRCVAVTVGRLHHRFSAHVNPKGGGTMVELRTSDTKRYYANRNGLVVLLKNCQHVLLLSVPLLLALFVAEALVSLFLIRRWSFIRRAYLGAVADCWRLRAHICAERRRIATFRRRGDWWMLRFLRARLNRWDELRRMLRLGRPKVTEA